MGPVLRLIKVESRGALDPFPSPCTSSPQRRSPAHAAAEEAARDVAEGMRVLQPYRGEARLRPSSSHDNLEPLAAE